MVVAFVLVDKGRHDTGKQGGVRVGKNAEPESLGDHKEELSYPNLNLMEAARNSPVLSTLTVTRCMISTKPKMPSLRDSVWLFAMPFL